MNTTSFVVCGFHQGRKLKPQHFPSEALAREHALYMSRTLDCVVLTTSMAALATQRDYRTRASVRSELSSMDAPQVAVIE
jgi:hypothetical protein